MKKLIVSAGGNGSRMSPLLESRFPGLPKHLLPVGRGGTLLSRIVDQALVYFDRVVISTSESNHGQIESVFGGLKEVLVEVDRHHTGPLGPQVRELLSGNGRAYGCAGDYFCRFDWESFEKFHDLVGNPASILTARSAVVPDGARFVLDHRGRVTGWKRVAMTESRDLINIGAYILDPSAASELVKLSRHKEDGFFDLFIAASKLAGYDPGVLGFNINTPDTYDQLCRFLNEGEDE